MCSIEKEKKKKKRMANKLYVSEEPSDHNNTQRAYCSYPTERGAIFERENVFF